MAGTTNTLESGFKALKNNLKKASIEAIEADRFDQSRRYTEIMEQLLALETRTLELAGGKAEKVPPRVKKIPTKKPRKEEYPRFYRSGRTLYKEGLKQGGNATYTQKVDRSAFDGIAQTILKQQGKFRPAAVLEKLEHPSYQLYIVLNVLQEAGLVEKPERGAYRITAAAKKADADVVWEELAQSASLINRAAHGCVDDGIVRN